MKKIIFKYPVLLIISLTVIFYASWYFIAKANRMHQLFSFDEQCLEKQDLKDSLEKTKLRAIVKEISDLISSKHHEINIFTSKNIDKCHLAGPLTYSSGVDPEIIVYYESTNDSGIDEIKSVLDENLIKKDDASNSTTSSMYCYKSDINKDGSCKVSIRVYSLGGKKVFLRVIIRGGSNEG